MRGEAGKRTADFVLDSQRAFPDAEEAGDIEDFCDLAALALSDATFFDDPDTDYHGFERKAEWLKFSSGVVTDVEKNNVVQVKITESGSHDRVLVIFHHWNARSWQGQIASFFSWCGISVVEMSMPYHFERSRPGSTHADYMLSPNLGRTIESMRQAVWDGRKLIGWLKSEGYGEISVLGMSLGSWVAGLVAAHEPSVKKASLFLTAGSLADMVWTGRATRLIRESLETRIKLPTLRRAWAPVNMENYAERFARSDLDLQLVLARRDKVVMPELSQKFVADLKKAGANPSVFELNCGHYSLALPPHIILAGLRLRRLIRS